MADKKKIKKPKKIKPQMKLLPNGKIVDRSFRRYLDIDKRRN